MARLGATFLTVHAYPQTMKAAVEARESGLRILAVTVLTSYDDADLAAAGYDLTVPELVAERAAQARDIGVDGLVCAAEEAANAARHCRAKHRAGDAGHPAGRRRQRRSEAHHDAVLPRSPPGADYLVVGRPVIAAADPKAAANAIVDEIAQQSATEK